MRGVFCVGVGIFRPAETRKNDTSNPSQDIIITYFVSASTEKYTFEPKHTTRYIIKKYDVGCEIDDFVETHLCERRRIVRSRG